MRFLDGVLSILYALMTTFGMIGLKRALLEEAALLRSLNQALLLAGATALYFCGLGLWTVTLARNQLSVAYPIGIGLSLLSVTLGGHWAFEEALTLSKLAGGSFILLGALLISRSRP